MRVEPTCDGNITGVLQPLHVPWGNLPMRGCIGDDYAGRDDTATRVVVSRQRSEKRSNVRTDQGIRAHQPTKEGGRDWRSRRRRSQSLAQGLLADAKMSRVPTIEVGSYPSVRAYVVRSARVAPATANDALRCAYVRSVWPHRFLQRIEDGPVTDGGRIAPDGRRVTKVTSEYTIPLPQDTLSVVVYMNTWSRLKARVENCKRGVNLWESLFWSMLGVFVPSAVSAYQQYSTDTAAKLSFSINAWMLISVVSLVAGIFALIALRQSISQESDSIKAIIAEMEEIQTRFTRTPQ